MSRSVKIGETTVAGITFDQWECYVGDDAEKGIKGERVTYDTPKTADDHKKMVAAATGEAAIAAWERYCYGHGLKARAAGRPESGGVLLPVIMTKKYGTLNLVDGTFDGVLGGKDKKPAATKWAGQPVPLEGRVKMLNAAILLAQTMEQPAPRAVNAAREQLLAAKLVTDDKGMLKVAAK